MQTPTSSDAAHHRTPTPYRPAVGAAAVMGCDIHLNIVVQHPNGWTLVEPPKEPVSGPVDPWPRWPGSERDYEAFALLGYTGRCGPPRGVVLQSHEGWPTVVPSAIKQHPAWDEYDHSERWISAAELRSLRPRYWIEERFPAISTLATLMQHYARHWRYGDAILIFGFDN